MAMGMAGHEIVRSLRWCQWREASSLLRDSCVFAELLLASPAREK